MKSYDGGEWLVIDGDLGHEVLPIDVAEAAYLRTLFDVNNPEDIDLAKIHAAVRDKCESRCLYEADIQSGFCARLSGPDANGRSQWIGPFHSVDQALDALAEYLETD